MGTVALRKYSNAPEHRNGKMIIDFHTHNFPDSIAERAMATLIKNSFSKINMTAHTNGTASDAERHLRSFGIDRAVVCNIATNTHQESKVNSYALSLLSRGDFFSPLGSVHPDSEKKAEELNRLLGGGIRGIKLHADYAGIELSDERYSEIFGLLEERKMFAVLHMGFDPVSTEHVHATPNMLLPVIRRFPRLKLVAAHMGSFKMAKEVLSTIVGTNIYIDTSLSSLRSDETELLHTILREHSPERILFGTDTPWSDPKEEIAFVENAPIDEKRREMIFYKNAASLLFD